MHFKSKHPDIHAPTDQTVYTWLFESPRTSPLHKYAARDLGGYTNPITKERVNWAQVRQYATYASTALVRRYGLQEGDAVALFSGNTIWYPVAMFAVGRAGGKTAGASPAYNVEEMTYALKTADAKFLMTGPDSIDVAAAAARNAGIPRERVFLLDGDGNIPGYTTFKQLIELGRAYGDGDGDGEQGQGQVPVYRIPRGMSNVDVCGFLCFSSGTTGMPKAVMLSHHNIIAQAMQLRETTPGPPKTVLGVLPLFHVTGLVRFCNLPVFFNDELILLPQFNLEHMLQFITEYKVRELALVPPLVIRLVNDPLVAKYDLSSLTKLSSGAAPLSKEIVKQLAKRFPHVGFRQGYGMTESTACISSHSPKYYDFKFAGTVGDLVPSTTIKIIDAAGAELGFDMPGEILARGPQIAMGYLNNAEASAESFDADGWLHTGDIGSMSEEGLLTISDRIKEMIKVKGIAVAPAELEDLLLGHNDVADCAVLGIGDDYAGERPKAYVVLRPGVKPSEAVGGAILGYVRERKARFKWLREIEFAEEVPKSASGKILRRLLRDRERGDVRGLVVRDGRERARL